MQNFNRGGNRFGGGRNFRRPEFGRRDSSDRSMHKTTCSKCGNECEVPFKPTGIRPVYCSKCFEHNRSSDSGRFEEKNTNRNYNNNYENKNENAGGNSDSQLKKQFETLNWKLDKILKIISPVATPMTASVVTQTEIIDKKVKVFKPKKATKESKKEKPAVKKPSTPKF